MKILIPYKGKLLNSFEGHKGRPGEVGGSLPKNSTELDDAESRLKSVKEKFSVVADKYKDYKDSSGNSANHPEVEKALDEVQAARNAINIARLHRDAGDDAVRLNTPELMKILKPMQDLAGGYDKTEEEKGWFTPNVRWGRGSQIGESRNLGKEYEAVPKVGGNRVLFRGVSVDDWNRMQKNGYVDTDMRDVIDRDEGMNLSPDVRTAAYYLPMRSEGVILAMKTDHAKLFKIEPDEYIRTKDKIPLSDVLAVSPVIGRHDDVDYYIHQKRDEKIKNSFNPDESRDENGRWVVGGVTVYHGVGDKVFLGETANNTGNMKHVIVDKVESGTKASLYALKAGLPPIVETGPSSNDTSYRFKEIYTPDEKRDYEKISGAVYSMVGSGFIRTDQGTPLESQLYDPASFLKQKVSEDLSKQTELPYVEVSPWIKAWANSSNDHNFDSLVRQNAAENVLGAKMSEWQIKSYEDVLRERNSARSDSLKPYELNAGLQSTFDDSSDYCTDEGCLQSSEKILKKVYQNTQDFFTKLGYKSDDEITLFRGAAVVGANKFSVGEKCNMERNALESWTYDKSVATDFAFDTNPDDKKYNPIITKVVLGAKFKISDIVSTPATGFGCLVEKEIVVHNARDVKGTVLWVS